MYTAGRVGAGRPAAVYARAPHPSERDRTPTDQQVEACRRLAADLGYSVADDAVIVDTGPNTTLSRPGLGGLIGLTARGKVSAVITHTLDRLGRSDSRPLEALLKEWRRRNVAVYVARVPTGYRYDASTGAIIDDPEEVARGNREQWRPPEYIVIPTEDDPGG